MKDRDWKIKRLGELIVHRKGFAFKSKWFSKEGKRVIKVSDFTDNSIDINKTLFIPKSIAKSFAEYELHHNDIIIATVGSWPNNPASIVGKVVRVGGGAEGALLNQNAVILRVKDAEVNQPWLYYRLKTPSFSAYLVSRAQGSANQASITLADILDFEFELPPIKEQEYIAKVVSNFDSRIELLQQQNKTLEAMGEALFKHWFVDFEFPDVNSKPYKSNGGKLIDSELGEIPEGWLIKNIKDLLIFEKGTEPGHKNYTNKQSEDVVRFLRVGDINLRNNGTIFVPLNTDDLKFCKEQDILISLDATIGIVKIGMNGAYSSGIRRVYSKAPSSIPAGYIYFLLESKQVQDILYNFAKGTTILHAESALNHIYVATPNKIIFDEFSKLINPMFKKLISNLIDVRILEGIRDLLLPKLISGQIRVPLEVIQDA